jgi:hypothetical protein
MPIVAEDPFIWVVMHLGLALMQTLIIVGAAALVRLFCIVTRVGQVRGRLCAVLVPSLGYFLLVTGFNVRDVLSGHADLLYIAWNYAPCVLLGLLWAVARLIFFEYRGNH